MDFFSGIGVWLEKMKSALFIYRLLRLTSDQLTFITSLLKPISDIEWASLNYATGYAITGWALMEDRLVLLASLLLRTTPTKTGLVFFSIINFQVWITIITELFELDEEFKPFQRRWNKIFERLRAEKDNRDRLAHHYIMPETVAGNPLGIPIKIASLIDMRTKSRKAAPMTVDQVFAFRTRINAIGKDLEELHDAMLKHIRDAPKASQEKSSEQDSDQRT